MNVKLPFKDTVKRENSIGSNYLSNQTFLRRDTKTTSYKVSSHTIVAVKRRCKFFKTLRFKAGMTSMMLKNNFTVFKSPVLKK